MQETQVSNLKINKLTKAQYTGITPNQNEVYITTDEAGAVASVNNITPNASGNVTLKTSNITNDSGYLTGITSGDVTTALGYTPYNSTNPSGYQANVIETVKVNGTAQTVTSKAVDISVPTQASDIGAEAALGYTPANVSLSNLDATGQKVLDGQWVYSDLTLVNNVTWDNTYTSPHLDLSNYLPNDGNIYEVMIIGEAATGTTSGQFVSIYLSSDLISNVEFCSVRTRSTASLQSAGVVVIPVGSGRWVSQYKSTSSNANGTFSLYAKAYRRVGTNN